MAELRAKRDTRRVCGERRLKPLASGGRVGRSEAAGGWTGWRRLTNGWGVGVIRVWRQIEEVGGGPRRSDGARDVAARRARMSRCVLGALGCLAMFVSFSSVSHGADTTYAPDATNPTDPTELVRAKLAAGEYSRRGADNCLACHDDATFPTHAVFLTKHGSPNVAGSPFASEGDLPVSLQCEACHGPLGDHGRQTLADGERREPMISHSPGSIAPSVSNALCLACHDDENRADWHVGPHETAAVSCAGCHFIHDRDDPSLTAVNDQCGACHRTQSNAALLRSAHPLRHGQMQCIDCHDPHGEAPHPFDTVEQCVTCHAEKRGPFLFEHAPVVDDCTTCHDPHGSNQPALLVRRPPQLCQSCHSTAGHRNLPQTQQGLPSNSPSHFLLSRGCTNCHSAVHGSNHPDGVLFRR